VRCLEDLRQHDPNAYPDVAGAYLNRWCEDTHGFQRKYYGEDKKEPLYELTSGSEKALLWLESLRRTGFVGTESRLQSIFSGLEEILKFASRDADERIARLNDEAGRILAEIDRIRATGEVKTFTAGNQRAFPAPVSADLMSRNSARSSASSRCVQLRRDSHRCSPALAQPWSDDVVGVLIVELPRAMSEFRRA
jgi:hypothetical protein